MTAASKPTDPRFDEMVNKFFDAETPEQEQEFEDWLAVQPDKAVLEETLEKIVYKPTDAEIQKKIEAMRQKKAEQLK
jgi:hypothetical protein